MSVLETNRLRLRELESSDLDFAAEMLGDAEVMRFYPACLTRDETRDWIDRQRARYSQDGYGLWLVELKASGEPVGQVGLMRQWVHRSPEPEIGCLVHRPMWRRGYAAEAAGGVRDYALGVLGLPRVVSLVRPDNVPSQGVATKIGMTRQGTALHAFTPHLLYALDHSAWSVETTDDRR